MTEEHEAREMGRFERLLHLSDRYWLLVTVLSFLAMGIVWVVARLVATAGLAVAGLAGCVVAAVVLSLLAAAALAGAVVGPLRARGRVGGPPWEVASVVLAVASLGLFVEAMAAITAVTWRQAGLPVSAWGGLWRAEEFYLYQLVRSVPLLDLPATVGWREPAYAAAHTSPGLQLAFLFIVIAPLLRIAVEGYRLIVERASQLATAEWVDGKVFDRGFDRSWTLHEWYERFGARAQAAIVFGVFVLKGLALGTAWYLVFSQAFTDGSWLDRHWLQLLHAAHGDDPRWLPWLRLVPPVVVLIASWWVFGLLLATIDESTLDTRWRMATPVAQTITALFCAMLFISGVLLLLRELGVPGPAVGGHPVDAVMATLGRQLVGAVPGPDIAATLHWTAPVAVAGSPWGWFAMVPKFVLLGSAIAVWLPGVRVGTFRQRYAPVLEFWFAAVSALQPTAFHSAEDITAAYEELTHRPEFAALLPAAEQVRAATNGDARQVAADRFLAAVHAEVPEVAQALRTIALVVNDEEIAVPNW